jgi:hypothetical protein
MKTRFRDVFLAIVFNILGLLLVIHDEARFRLRQLKHLLA